jgi:hypothetical protein
MPAVKLVAFSAEGADDQELALGIAGKLGLAKMQLSLRH